MDKRHEDNQTFLLIFRSLSMNRLCVCNFLTVHCIVHTLLNFPYVIQIEAEYIHL